MADLYANLAEEDLVAKSYKNHLPHWHSLAISLGSFYFGIMIVYFQTLKSACIGNENSFWTDVQSNISLVGVVVGVLFITKPLVTRNSRRY